MVKLSMKRELLVLVVTLLCVATMSCRGVARYKPNTHVIFGTVQSIWRHHQFTGSDHVLIGFETDSRELLTIEIEKIDPRVWQGLHAKLTLQEVCSVGRTGCDGHKICTTTGNPLFHLKEIVRLE